MLTKNKKNLSKNPINITYTAEYTDELEVTPDYENIKKIPITDLDSLIFTMLELRKQQKNNISIGYTIADNKNNWLIEDYANNLEFLTDSKLSDKLETKVSKQSELIAELSKELELYQEFLEKYQAIDQFNKFKQEREQGTKPVI